MRLISILATTVAALALTTAAQAQDAPTQETPAVAPAAPAPTGDFTDAELAQFGAAMEQLLPIAQAAGGSPSTEQQAQMAGIVQASGLTPERFNEISTAVSADAALQARVALAAAPAPAAGSVAASVTDQELTQFAGAIEQLLPIAQAAGGSPSAEQQAQMAGIVQESGLTPERFNEISTAVSQDESLRARIAVLEAGVSN